MSIIFEKKKSSLLLTTRHSFFLYIIYIFINKSEKEKKKKIRVKYKLECKRIVQFLRRSSRFYYVRARQGGIITIMYDAVLTIEGLGSVKLLLQMHEIFKLQSNILRCFFIFGYLIVFVFR